MGTVKGIGSIGSGYGGFPETRWELLKYTDGRGWESSAEAAQICTTYWRPLYVWFRKVGASSQDAEDLTQELMTRLLHNGFFKRARRGKGKLRTLFLKAAKDYWVDTIRYDQAAKRGGGIPLVSLDFPGADQLNLADRGRNSCPDLVFDRQWALDLLDRSLRRLRESYLRCGKGELFDALLPHLLGEGEAGGQAETACGLRMHEPAFRKSLSRFRKRFRAALDTELRATLADGTDIKEETREIMAILQG